MKIAIDYDKTITLDPNFWGVFIGYVKRCGHEIYIVTMRTPDESEEIVNQFDNIDVFSTSRKAKYDYLQAINKLPDVWIDDSPFWILNDSK